MSAEPSEAFEEKFHLDPHSRAVVLGAYLSCLRSLVNGFSSREVTDNQCKSLMKNDLIHAATDLKFISLVHGHGKGTFFCNLPEKEVLITGNEDLYKIFTKIYKTPQLLVNSTAFRVLVPGFHNTRTFIDMDIFNPDLPGTREIAGRYSAIMPINDAFGHRLEVLVGVDRYLDLFKIYFNPTEGHPDHRLSASSWKIPICVNSKALDIVAFNNFLKNYSAMYHGTESPTNEFEAAILSKKDRPAVEENPAGLRWTRFDLVPDKIVIWKNCLPYRFVAESLTTSICVDLDYFPIDASENGTYQSEWFSARVNRMMTKHPYSKRNAAMETRTERDVVAFKTKHHPYTSPYTENDEYYNPLATPLLKVLSGHDFKGNLYLWSDYYKETAAMDTKHK